MVDVQLHSGEPCDWLRRKTWSEPSRRDERGAEGVRGDAAGQPHGQDDQDRHDPALQVQNKSHSSGWHLLNFFRVGADGRPEAVDHVLQLQEAMQGGHQAR